MKNLFYFLLLAVVVVSGCKKKDKCEDVICQNGGVCVNGVCQCDTGYSGVQCEVYDSCTNVNCGAHGHCVNGICNCDSGWMGAGCRLEAPPMASFVGSYHMTGYRNCSSIGDTTHYLTYIEDTIVVTKVDSIFLHISSIYWTDFMFTTTDYGGSSLDSVNKYNFREFPITPISIRLFFHRPFNNDSVFYESFNNSVSSPCFTTLRGKKIH